MGLVAVDLFAGGGGASEGIRRALGIEVHLAVNHDPASIAMHAANHPATIHLEESVWRVSPTLVVGRRNVDLLWASPDCTHFSRAKGGKPRSQEIRSLAWVVVEWARLVRPLVICLENVPEFTTWGPLDSEGNPIREQAGETFRLFVGRLQLMGYRVEWRTLVAADYGAPTTRRRLFLVARCDGEPIVWPEPTHGPGRALPWRAAAECIDWETPCPSIFERSRPLAEATQRRIAEGIRRYVLEAPKPFLVHLTHGGRVHSLDEPLRTVTAAHRGEQALVVPAVIHHRGCSIGREIGAPAPTVTATFGGHLGLVAAFLAKHYGGVVGHSLERPIGTVTGIDHHSLAAVWLDKLHGSARAGVPVDQPAPTVAAGGGRGGGHAALCAAFLAKYYGTGAIGAPLSSPAPTVTSRDRLALVTVELDGEPWVLTDIGMRMLQPRELARAQGFADSYVLTGTKSQQVARIGNSVPPPVVEAIVRSQFGRAMTGAA